MTSGIFDFINHSVAVLSNSFEMQVRRKYSNLIIIDNPIFIFLKGQEILTKRSLQLRITTEL